MRSPAPPFRPRAAALLLALLLALPAAATATAVQSPADTVVHSMGARHDFETLGRARVLGARDASPLPRSRSKRSFVGLFMALSKGDLRAAARRLPPGGQLDDIDTKTGATPLTWAAQFGRADMVALLLERGADVEGVDGQRSTPLATAARYGHLEVVRLLLAHGADADRPTPLGMRPLLLACGKQGSHETVLALIRHGANPHLCDANGWTPLAMAAKHGRVRTAARLLELGASPDGAPHADYTPLHWAATENQLQTATLLVRGGANVNRAGARGETPLDWSASEPLRKLLLGAGATPLSAE